MKIDKNHPRFLALSVRERLVDGVKKGITSHAGLIAHGRGEAFDYLLGEKTHGFAKESITAAACYLLLAKNPILSINGNAAALCAEEFVKIAKFLDCKIEVNLFHYTKTREKCLEACLSNLDPSVILSSKGRKTRILPNVASPRKIILRDGIGRSDTVFVPLEDGDRCGALVSLGKKVITIDLNPLSRSSQTATVTIVDNITRAMPKLLSELRRLQKFKPYQKKEIVRDFDNKTNLARSFATIQKNLSRLAIP
ncbi:phosphopantothenate/pantothenate synthetase [Candidatus Gottesmanbacteria bacterium]|nr:phosphopantothenate/pantothenate synthetase [Candidatus Gottesmanbacteria bacterium]